MDSHKRNSVVLVVALLAASTLVVVLGFQNRSLRDRTRELFAMTREPHRGFVLPTVKLETIAGDSVQLAKSDSGHAQLLFVFATACRHCRASLSAWNQIADHLGHNTGVQIIGISTDSILPTQSLVAEHEMRFPVVSMVDPKLRALYRSRVVPQTLLLDANGIITYARLGAVEGIVAIDSIMVQVDLAIGRATTGSNRAVAMPESG